MRAKLPEFVQEIFDKFQKANFEIYVVGGSVRDLLMNREVSDWDFTTNAAPEQILKLFPKGFYDNKFGTVGISHPSSKFPYEITTFRKEIGYSDRRHPDKVVWGEKVEEDLARRDFTINAIALRLASLSQGKPSYKLIDPFNGQKDLKAKLVRAVGDPHQRFNEDALRLMRAVRIATQLGFTIEEKTFQAIKDNASLINKIAAERVRDELIKIISTNHPADGFMLLKNSALLHEILPELEKAFDVPQKSPGRHHLYDVGTHSIMSLKHCSSDDPIVRLATLIHDLGKVATFKKQPNGTITFYNHEVVSTSIARNFTRRFRFSKKERQKLITLVRWHQFTVDERQTDSAIRRFIRNVGKDNLKHILDLRVGDRLGGGARETSWRLEKFKKRLVEVQKQPFSVSDLKVSGHDVMKILGLSSGPMVGRVLNQIFKEVVKEGTPNEKKILLKRVKEIGKKL
jgi:tRNA nucleotidyltransferase/poly(A) polymerase